MEERKGNNKEKQKQSNSYSSTLAQSTTVSTMSCTTYRSNITTIPFRRDYSCCFMAFMACIRAETLSFNINSFKMIIEEDVENVKMY